MLQIYAIAYWDTYLIGTHQSCSVQSCVDKCPSLEVVASAMMFWVPGTSPTLITVSSPNSDSSRSFYPDYSASSGECRNDGNAPNWISSDMMKTSKLECCESYFFPSSLEECKSDHPYYPNFRDKTCANDGNQPSWMSGSYLVQTMNLCCENFFRDDQSRLACLGR